MKINFYKGTIGFEAKKASIFEHEALNHGGDKREMEKKNGDGYEGGRNYGGQKGKELVIYHLSWLGF